MANLGLLGALGGLGEGMTKMGEDILERRERALEWARQEAIEQRRLAQRSAEKDEDRAFQRDQTIYREDRADIRNERDFSQRKELQEDTQSHSREGWENQDARTDRTQAAITARSQATQAAQDKRWREAKESDGAAAGLDSETRAEAGRRFRELQKKLLKVKGTGATNLRNKLSQRKDIIGIDYGPPNEDGTVPLLGLMKDGKLRYTGYAVRPALLGDDYDPDN